MAGSGFSGLRLLSACSPRVQANNRQLMREKGSNPRFSQRELNRKNKLSLTLQNAKEINQAGPAIF